MTGAATSIVGPMDEEQLAEWIALGDRLKIAGQDKFEDVVGHLRAVVEAQEIIARFDHQLLFRARRPTKRYLA